MIIFFRADVFGFDRSVDWEEEHFLFFGRSREARCVAARPLRLILLTLLTKIDTAHNR